MLNQSKITSYTIDLQDTFPCYPFAAKQPRGTQPELAYIAPECLLGKDLTDAADVWSLGMLICTVFRGGDSLLPIDLIESPDQLMQEVNHVSSN